MNLKNRCAHLLYSTGYTSYALLKVQTRHSIQFYSLGQVRKVHNEDLTFQQVYFVAIRQRVHKQKSKIYPLCQPL